MNKLIKILILISLIIALTNCGGSSGDIKVPPATNQRTDLYYGYYGGGAQVLEAVGHTNLIFESGLFGPTPQLNVIEQAGKPAILDISNEVYIGPLGSDRTINPNIENNLRRRFNELRSRDLLKYVIGLYPIDEPDNTVVDANVIREANGIIRKIAAEYPELKDVKLVVIYANAYKLPAIKTFDWIGFDHYDNHSSIFINGEYASLLSKLGPNQRTIIVPGGAYDQDITPFLNFAETHNEVIAIIPFLWFDNSSEKIPGIRSNGMAPSYCLAGMQIVYPNQNRVCEMGVK